MIKEVLLKKAVKLIKNFGLRGLFIGLNNKLHGRPLMTNLEFGGKYLNFHSSDEYNQRGIVILNNQQSEVSRQEQIEVINHFEYKPKISIIMPIYNAPIKWLNAAINSIREQSYSNWELCVVDDGSKDLRGDAFIKRIQQDDRRISYRHIPENKGVSEASNIAIAMSNGEYIALMNQGDMLTSDALFWVVKEINSFPNVDMIYSDECKTMNTIQPTHCDFYFKPDWSPELLINHMYVGHLSVYRASLIKKIGGFRKEFDFSQDYDLALRVTERTNQIRHIERVLYYWRKLPTSGASGGKKFARISNVSALRDAFYRRGLDVHVSIKPYGNDVCVNMKTNPLVSIIIPSDNKKNIEKCVEGLTGESTSYKNIEIIPVTNSMIANELETSFCYIDNLKICKYDKQYNFSDKCNVGAKIASGEYLVIYNDDVYPRSIDWIERLLEVLQYDGVGAASPLMLYEDDTIQYAGMVCNVPGQVGTSFNGFPYDITEQSPFTHFLIRDVSILSGACTILKRNLFFDIGGFDALNTPTGHSDVDLSFKILNSGLRCVYTPYSVLTHVGNHSWKEMSKQDKSQIFCLKKWGKYISRDPYFTNSMKKAYYYDFPFEYNTYYPEKIKNAEARDAKDILFISHELTLTGAPILMMDAVSLTIKNGDFPVVICPIDGPLRKKYSEMGVTVIVDESIIKEPQLFYNFAKDFDLVVVNTLVCTEAIEALSYRIPPVIWWIHDGVEVIQNVRNKLPKEIGKNIRIYCASEYSQRLLEEFGEGYSSEIFRCGVDDFATEGTSDFSQGEKIVFLTIGSLEERKGQDILLQAIDLLPTEYRDKALFYIIGNPLQDKVLNLLEEYSKKYSCIRCMPPIQRQELLNMYPTSICSIIPSRDEPTSMIAIESMMYSRAVIASDKTGISEFLENGENGLIFPTENVEELAHKIMYVIDNVDEVIMMGKKARKVYEKNYMMTTFTQRFNEITRNIMRK